jgi:type II secretory pathway component GspD/PulD (secretin)
MVHTSIRCLVSIGIVLAVIAYPDAQNKPQPPQPQIILDSNAIKQQVLSVDVKDTDIRDVIRMISKGYNLNILLDQGVSGKVTLHLVNVPIMEGLKNIAESNGFALLKDGNVYKIQKATAEEKNLIRYVDGKLTVDVQNVNVKEFLKELSSKTAISIVPESKVDGLISGKLFQVDLDDGLRAILEGNGYKVVRRRNIYQVEASDQANPGGQSIGGMSNRYRNNTQGANFFVDYKNGLVSINVSNGDLEDIVNAIADQSEIEIVTYGSIKTEINAKLTNTPLTEALALLLGGTRFTFVQKDNVILIGDRNTATPSGQALSKSELVHLRHIKADLVPAILPKDIPPTNIRVIKEQNALLISGTSEDIVAARDFLATIDIPTPQVRIDAVIVEFKSNLNKEFGMRSGKNADMVDNSYNITPAPALNGYEESSSTEIGISGKFFKDLLSGLFDGTGIFKNLPDDFFVALHFLETQDKAKVLARPSILTLNGNKASIDVSETQYFTVETGTGENHTSRFQPIKFGIQLDITPWISQSGQITAEITPNISNSDKLNSEGYPNVSSRSITTTVRLNDGETLVLGGLIKNQESESHDKIPVLGNLPLIGRLFRSSSKTQIQSNLVVFITPHVVREHEKNVDVEKEIEDYDIHDMNFIEKRIHNAVKKVRGTKTFNKKSKSKDIDTLQTVPLVKDTTSSVIVLEKNTVDTAKVKTVPDTSGIEKKL